MSTALCGGSLASVLEKVARPLVHSPARAPGLGFVLGPEQPKGAPLDLRKAGGRWAGWSAGGVPCL